MHTKLANIADIRTGFPFRSKVIDDQRIADVAEYVFQAFIVAQGPQARAAAGAAR